MICELEDTNKYLQFVIDFELTAEDEMSSGVNFCNIPLENGMSVIYITEEEYAKLNVELDKYPYIPKCYGILQQEAVNNRQLMEMGVMEGQAPNLQPLDAAGIIRVQNPPLSLTGSGVILAFIDTGIQYTLPYFRNADGSSRILAIWDQTLSAEELNQNRERILELTGKNLIYNTPEDFGYGVLFTREQINTALMWDNPYEIVPTRDENGHGTEICSVAAGSFLEENGFRGAAYDADIVVVKLRQSPDYLREYYQISKDKNCYSDPDILLGLKFIQSFTKPFFRPISVCFALGTTWGNHNGESILSRYLEDFSLKRSSAMVIGCGNEGNKAGHFFGEIDITGKENWKDVELLIGKGEKGFVMELWGKLPAVFSVEITSPAGEFLQRIPYRMGQSVAYRFVYSKTELTVNYVAIEQASGEEVIIFRFVKPLDGVWKIRVFGEGSTKKSEFNLWLPMEQFLHGDTFFLTPNPDTTLTEPAYCRGALGVVSYQSDNNSIEQSSGRGFSSDGFIQPDLAAPGVGISTAYGQNSGSSFSAAITAGAVADFMQWAVVEGNNSLVNTEIIRNYFIRGAERDYNLDYPNRIWGYGRLDMTGTFEQIAGINPRL